MPRSFDSVFYGAAGTSTGGPSDDEFNRVSFLSHFDGANNGVNNAFDDGSTSNHTITANGNVTQGSFSPFARPDGEWGWSFDGSGDNLKVPDSTDFDCGTGDFCLELFIFSGGAASNPILITFGGGFYLQLKDSMTDISFYTGSTEIVYSGSASLTDNAWHHIAITREGSSLRHFLDGSLVKTTSNSDAVNGSGEVLIGTNTNGSSLAWTGLISNLRLVNGSAVYTSAFTVPTSKLTAVTNTKLLTCQSNRLVDNSTSAHTVTPSGNASVSAFGPFLTDAAYDPAVNGASAYLDGSGDFVTIPQTTDMDLSGDFTVECWAYFNEIKAMSFVNKWGGSGKFGWILYHTSGGTLQFYSGNSGSLGSVTAFNKGVTVGQWYHIAVARTGNTLSTFVNGVRTATATDTSNNTASTTTHVGTDGTSTTTWSIPGYLSDVRVIKGTAAYNGTTYTIPTAPLTAVTNTKLLLNMADGQAIDSAAQNNLTLYGNAKISTGQAKFGDTSLLLDGTGDYAELTDTNVGNFGTGNFTIECWFRSDQFDSLRTLASKYTTVNGFRSWRLVFQSSSKLQLDITADGGGSNIQNLLTAATFNANTWYHLAVVRNGATISIYINGTADSNTLNYGTATVFTSPTSVLIGAQSNSSGTRYYFDGYIDDFRISKMARYTGNFTAPTEPFPDKGQ